MLKCIEEIDAKRKNLIQYGTILSDLTIEKVNVRIRIFLLDGVYWYLHKCNGDVIEIYRLGIDGFCQRNMYKD